MAAQSPVSSEQAWLSWRSRVMTITLAAVALANFPALFGVLFQDHIAAPLWLKATYVGLELLLIVFALGWRWPFHVRAWVWIGSTFVIAIVGLARVGMAGSGRVFLLAIATYAVILVGRRKGAAVVAASVLLLGVFVGLAYAGEAESLLTVRHNPTDGGFWLFQAACWLMALAPGFVLNERFLAHQEGLLEAERRTVRRLEEEVATRIAAHQRLEAEMAERLRLEREVLEVGERERREVGYELHDGICQQIAGARLRCQAIERDLRTGAVPEPEQLLAVRELLDESLSHAYELSRGLKPMELDPASLAPALRELARKVQVTHELDCEATVDEGLGIDSGATATQLFHIALEASNNAIKHSGASSIQIRLARGDAGLELRVQDDGRGLAEPRPAGAGMGLRILRFRAHSIGADLVIESQPGGGTQVRCRLPARVPAEAT